MLVHVLALMLAVTVGCSGSKYASTTGNGDGSGGGECGPGQILDGDCRPSQRCLLSTCVPL